VIYGVHTKNAFDARVQQWRNQGGGSGAVGQWIIHDLLLGELFDVEYYRDLEMLVRGHSRSLKVVPF